MTHLLFQLRGSYASAVNSEEIWQTGVRMWMDNSVPDNTGTFPDIEILSDDASGENDAGPWSSNWTNTTWSPEDIFIRQVPVIGDWFTATGLISSECLISQIRLYAIDAQGEVERTPDDEPAVAIQDLFSPVAGDATGELMPLEVSCAASLYAYRTGPRGRGRMYLPPSPITALGAAGRWDDAYTELVSTTTADFMSALAVEAVLPTDRHARPVITGPSNWNQYSVVQTVRVGNVPDAQRRRRNRLAEVYTPTSVVYG